MKTDEKNISDDEFIKCPYCPKLLKKIDNRHLRIHNKKLKDMLIEIPDVKIVTRQAYDDYVEGEKKRKVGSKAAKSKKKKLICYFCKTEFEGSVFTPDICRCKECKKKGLSTPAAIEAHEKSKAAILEKFGVENVSHVKEIVEKRKVTFEKHKEEDENFMNRIYEKRENTVEEKFSTDCLTGRQFLTGKSRATFKEKTGYDHIFQDPKVQQKSIDKNMEKRNVEYSAQCPHVREKIKKANMEKRGYENPMMDPKVQEKGVQTRLKKYNAEYYSQTEEWLEKTKATNQRKRNVDHVMHDPDVVNKMIETNLKIYNHRSPMGAKHIQQKVIDTNQRKRNVDHVFQAEDVKKKITEVNFERYNVKVKSILIARLKFYKDFKIISNYLKLEFIDDEYQNSQFHHNWKCTKCDNNFKTTWSNIFWQSYKCPICYPRYTGPSFTELEVFEFIKSLNILYNNENLNIESSNKKIIKPLELDIYIPDKKLAIEYNGLRWHSEELLIRNVNKNHPYKIETYHLYKTEKCEKQDIQLIHIFEDEWIFKNDIVKSRLKQILGVNSGTRIHARECIIKEIDPKRKNNFLEEFHIQGPDASTIKLGAFHGEDLVSVMTFSKGNISKGSKHKEGVWELNRFCSDSDFHIPGIAGKLLSHFKKNYQWSEIFSYADRRWSQGNLYYKLGFKLISISRPNYWYIKNFRRIHRFTLRKRPDEPKDISERILRLKERYGIIWDCGNLKFQLVNSEK